MSGTEANGLFSERLPEFAVSSQDEQGDDEVAEDVEEDGRDDVEKEEISPRGLASKLDNAQPSECPARSCAKRTTSRGSQRTDANELPRHGKHQRTASSSSSVAADVVSATRQKTADCAKQSSVAASDRNSSDRKSSHRSSHSGNGKSRSGDRNSRSRVRKSPGKDRRGSKSKVAKSPPKERQLSRSSVPKPAHQKCLESKSGDLKSQQKDPQKMISTNSKSSSGDQNKSSSSVRKSSSKDRSSKSKVATSPKESRVSRSRVRKSSTTRDQLDSKPQQFDERISGNCKANVKTTFARHRGKRLPSAHRGEQPSNGRPEQPSNGRPVSVHRRSRSPSNRSSLRLEFEKFVNEQQVCVTNRRLSLQVSNSRKAEINSVGRIFNDSANFRDKQNNYEEKSDEILNFVKSLTESGVKKKLSLLTRNAIVPCQKLDFYCYDETLVSDFDKNLRNTLKMFGLLSYELEYEKVVYYCL